MLIDEYLAQVRQGELQSIRPGWGQGRTTFGGLVAALLLENLASEVEASNLLRSISVNFCGPLLINEPFQLARQVLSKGKSISQLNSQAIQAGNVVTQLTACYGIERASDIEVEASKVELGKPGEGTLIPFIPGITPEFIEHVEMRVNRGGLPFTKSKSTELAGWVRLRNLTGAVRDPHLLAIVDSWPPVVLQLLAKPCPSASVSWSMEICQPLSLLQSEVLADDWLYYDAVVEQAHHGYAHTVARIYHSDGTLIALSRQLIAVYDRR
ncbi:acyl-CoA thioesterase, TesB family protein [Oleiphilus messinensis]|uniref:Acyl-CoA thioesterase, TesB family protein n=1 Tax=Oleiphilus messinensis TaxID=141451 RepID=A0A1Y0IFL2_9GAMM|nr:thioesterase family protein [Oleiphilus messinensis]ARU58919.1 acyl-CoA thioesterase, TesB family protein [Oleiphilus messinensis]